MNEEELKNRIIELTKAVDQSATNHNTLVGRLMEAQELLSNLTKNIEDITDEKQ